MRKHCWLIALGRVLTMWRLSSITAFVSGCLLIPIPADACELINNRPNDGVLSGDIALGSVPGASGVVPRNVAFLITPFVATVSGIERDPWVVAKLSDGTPIVAVALPNGTFAPSTHVIALGKPQEPLPANTDFFVNHLASKEIAYTTSDQLDTTPPSQPEVMDGAVDNFDAGEGGCGKSSCSNYTSVTIKLKDQATDDLTPTKHLVYAIYLGQTAEEAATKVDADALHVSATHLVSIIDPVWFDRTVFLAVAAMDQAANFSQRSVVRQIHSSDNDGCSVQRPRRHLPIQAILPIMAMTLWLLRRVRRNSGH